MVPPCTIELQVSLLGILCLMYIIAWPSIFPTHAQCEGETGGNPWNHSGCLKMIEIPGSDIMAMFLAWNFPYSVMVSVNSPEHLIYHSNFDIDFGDMCLHTVLHRHAMFPAWILLSIYIYIYYMYIYIYIFVLHIYIYTCLYYIYIYVCIIYIYIFVLHKYSIRYIYVICIYLYMYIYIYVSSYLHVDIPMLMLHLGQSAIAWTSPDLDLAGAHLVVQGRCNG